MAKKAKSTKRPLKNIFRFLPVFIYILLVGCEDLSYSCDDCYLDIDAPLVMSDGYYRLTYLDDEIQTFATLKAETGSLDEPQKLAWMSNREIFIRDHWTNLVNPASYTDDEGVAYTVLGIWSEFIGDTITVYCGYTDQCDVHHVDSLKVIIE